MATSAVVHRTNASGTDGSSAASGGHVTRTTLVPFTGLTGTDSKIAYGQDKVYTLKAYVYAITDNDSPVRSLRVYIDNYGTSTGGSDVVWLDNGTTAANGNTAAVYWVHEEGVDELRPSSPMTFSTSSAYIPWTVTTAPVGDAARSTGSTALQLVYQGPIDSTSVVLADYTIDVDGPGATGTAAPTVIGVANNVINMTTAAAFDHTQATPPTITGAGAVAEIAGGAAAGTATLGATNVLQNH
jgi:hypothetical protein